LKLGIFYYSKKIIYIIDLIFLIYNLNLTS